MPSVPPIGGNPPSSPQPDQSQPPAPPSQGGGSGADNMTAFMKLFTPEQRTQFMNIMVQNLVLQIQQASKKYIKELRKERKDIEKQG